MILLIATTTPHVEYFCFSLSRRAKAKRATAEAFNL